MRGIRDKLLRPSSTSSTAATTTTDHPPAEDNDDNDLRSTSSSNGKTIESYQRLPTAAASPCRKSSLPSLSRLASKLRQGEIRSPPALPAFPPSSSSSTTSDPHCSLHHSYHDIDKVDAPRGTTNPPLLRHFPNSAILPTLTVQEPSPDLKPSNHTTHPTTISVRSPPCVSPLLVSRAKLDPVSDRAQPLPTPQSPACCSLRPSLIRSNSRESYIGAPSQQAVTAYDDSLKCEKSLSEHSHPSTVFNRVRNSAMSRRKIWVRRPGQSATLVQVDKDDLVDDVRDLILRKFTNSLGQSFDSPDLTLRVSPRGQANERVLGPEESVWRMLDEFYPEGQTVHEALLIDVPQRRTPRPSPRVALHSSGYNYEDHRPSESGNDYFPPMPAASPHNVQHIVSSSDTNQGYHHHHHPQTAAAALPQHQHQQLPASHPHSMSIIGTGQLPALPSPRERKQHHRPRAVRQQTASPSPANAAVHPHSRPRAHRDSASEMRHSSHAPAAPPLPTPPASEATSSTINVTSKVATPPIDHVASPHVVAGGAGAQGRYKKTRNSAANGNSTLQDQARESSFPAFGSQLLDGGAVPPISVLIVEDNIINLKLLEAFVKRLKVRWATAMNGRDAVAKWRSGGFHLVLMDIQLPIMSGLEATKEIRRLERINGIGVFARNDDKRCGSNLSEDDHAPSGDIGDGTEQIVGEDRLQVEDLFKSPVIIVALTASSLQSDRHEALAAGCNDFLTKVGFSSHAPLPCADYLRRLMHWLPTVPTLSCTQG